MPGATQPTAPPTATMIMPARNTRRAPSRPASLPIVGWATALARESPETRGAGAPMPTCRLVPMPVSAVAMIELLTGLSADPHISGARNRQPNGLRAAGWASWVMTGHAFVVLSRAVRRRQAPQEWLRRPPASGRAAAGPRRAGAAAADPG